MAQLSVGIFVLAFIGVALSAILPVPTNELLKQFKLLPKVNFKKHHPHDPSFAFQFKAKDGEVFEGHTYLIDESNPQVQRLDIQTKFFPDQAFQFEVIFAPHELHKSALCKTVQFVNNERNARTFGIILKFMQFFTSMMGGMGGMGGGGGAPALPGLEGFER